MPESRAQVWILAARPKTLPAAVAPVLIGTAMAHTYGGVHWLSAIAAMLGALLIQIGTNLANDYFDFKKGTDTGERLGPLRVTQGGLVTPEAMKRATMLVFALAILAGFYFFLWPSLKPISEFEIEGIGMSWYSNALFLIAGGLVLVILVYTVSYFIIYRPFGRRAPRNGS